jgi:hypothetical protein
VVEKKVEKNLKKGIDKGGEGWYYVKAVREVRKAAARERRSSKKDFEKSRKKYLTKAGACAKI